MTHQLTTFNKSKNNAKYDNTKKDDFAIARHEAKNAHQNQ
jgi:hypothetical protein